MLKIYFDQNVFDYLNQKLSPSVLKSVLKEKNNELVLSPINLFEIASCFKSGEASKSQKGKELSKYFHDLLPIKILNDSPELYKREAYSAINHDYNGIFLDPSNQQVFAEELSKLSRGVFDDVAKTAVQKDWEERIAGRKHFEKFYKEPGKLTRKDVKYFSFPELIKNEHNAYSDFQSSWIEITIKRFCPEWTGKIVKAALKRIIRHPDKYPMFSVGARINLYINFKTAKDGTFAQDLPMDLKHLLCLCYADCFVTGDKTLLKIGREIQPHKKMVSIDEYF